MKFKKIIKIKKIMMKFKKITIIIIKKIMIKFKKTIKIIQT